MRTLGQNSEQTCFTHIERKSKKYRVWVQKRHAYLTQFLLFYFCSFVLHLKLALKDSNLINFQVDFGTQRTVISEFVVVRIGIVYILDDHSRFSVPWAGRPRSARLE